MPEYTLHYTTETDKTMYQQILSLLTNIWSCKMFSLYTEHCTRDRQIESESERRERPFKRISIPQQLPDVRKYSISTYVGGKRTKKKKYMKWTSIEYHNNFVIGCYVWGQGGPSFWLGGKIIRNSWASNQHIWMISEGSCEKTAVMTAKNSALPSQE